MPPIAPSLPLHILFVFLDGVGLGAEHPDNNPFCQLNLPAFWALGGGQPWMRSMQPLSEPSHIVHPLDATLDVQGLPQSGTGQATLFTGVNCAQAAGRHYGPYPHSKTLPILSEQNIFSQAASLGMAHPEPVAFANAYPDVFFESSASRNRWTVTTYACIEAQTPIRKLPDVQQGQALTADLTGQAWIDRLDLPIQLITEREAARNLASISRHHPFTLFEYFLTDKAGHSQSAETSADVLLALDALFDELMKSLDFSRTLLVVTSDHGNLEDLSTRSHTLNPVPFIAYGNQAHRFQHLNSLLGVTPAIVKSLRECNTQHPDQH